MYISILDYVKGAVTIVKLPKDKDPEEWLSEQEYRLRDIEWMATDELSLEIKGGD
jgi:hypothetical protein